MDCIRNEAVAVFEASQALAEASMATDPPAEPEAVAQHEAREGELFARAYAAGEAVLKLPAVTFSDFAKKLSVVARQERGWDELLKLIEEMSYYDNSCSVQ